VSISICTHMTFSFPHKKFAQLCFTQCAVIAPPNPHVGLEFSVLSPLLLPSSFVLAANLLASCSPTGLLSLKHSLIISFRIQESSIPTKWSAHCSVLRHKNVESAISSCNLQISTLYVIFYVLLDKRRTSTTILSFIPVTGHPVYLSVLRSASPCLKWWNY